MLLLSYISLKRLKGSFLMSLEDNGWSCQVPLDFLGGRKYYINSPKKT